MSRQNAQLAEQAGFVVAFPAAVPSSASPKWISLKNALRLTIVILANNATTVTGSAVGLSQATAVAGTGAKTLAFTIAKRNIDTAAAGGDVLADFAVSSNTFTTDATNSKSLMYVIDVDPASLDVANGFDCVRVTLGNGTATTVTALYILTPLRHTDGAPATNLTD